MIKTVFLSLLLIMNTCDLIGMTKKDHMRRERVRLNAKRQAKAGTTQVVHVREKSEYDMSPTHTPNQDDSKSNDSPVSPVSSEEEVADELKNLDLDGDDQDQEVPEDREGIMYLLNELMGAIVKAEHTVVGALETMTVPALGDKKALAVLLNNFDENMKKLSDQQRIEVQHFLHSYKIKNCSFLWAAAEVVFDQARKPKKDASEYKQSLEIVRILARVTTDKSERHVLYTQDVVLSSFLCCVCASKTINVEGGLLHRAAQEDNPDVMGILLESGFDRDAKDSLGLTVEDYATKFKRLKVKEFLK